MAENSLFSKNCTYEFILFGGDRLSENGPLSKLSIFLKKEKKSYLSIIDPSHAKQKVAKNITLKNFLKKKM